LNISKIFSRQWARFPLLDRWILSELIPPLLFGIGAFTAVSFSVGAVFEILRKISETSVPFGDLVKILLLQIPSFMVISFPMATLMAALLSYGKLASTSELTALRSLGVSQWRMVAPGVALACVMMFLTLGFNEWVVPNTMYQSEALLDRSLGRAIVGESAQNITYSKFGSLKNEKNETINGLRTFFAAREFRDDMMFGITVLDFADSERQMLIQAQSGSWLQDEGSWEFKDGTITILPSGPEKKLTTGGFDSYVFKLGREPIQAAKLPKDFDVFSNTLTVGQAMTAERLLRESGQTKRARKFQVRIQEKFSFPAVCLVFGLLGSSLGSRPTSRQSNSNGFGLTVIFLFLYYLGAYIFSMVGINGFLPPFVAAWSPVFIGLSTGAFLVARSSR
jgi:lipopolysaccharide export system permease protein